MLCQEAVVAVETVLLVVVLAAHQGAVALDAHEALEVPTFLSVRDEVLDMYWEGAAGAVLGIPLSLLLAPAITVMCDASPLTAATHMTLTRHSLHWSPSGVSRNSMSLSRRSPQVLHLKQLW